MIALICDDSQREQMYDLLREFDDVRFYKDGTELAFYLVDGGSCRLAVVAKDSAEGMNDCGYIKGKKSLGSTLWITEQEAFVHQSRRMGVAGFMVKPVTDEALWECVGRLLDGGEMYAPPM